MANSSWRLGERNLVVINDAQQGGIRETIPIDKPHALAMAKDGSLLVVSESKVLSVKDRTVKLFADQELDQPAGIAVDAEGRVFVANRGKLQNVSVYSSEGRYLKSIGKTGGRPAVGRYEKDGLLEPGGIAIDANGNLWAAETLDSPKRHSVWSTADGKLINEFFGASAYFGWIWMDPTKPDDVYCHNVLWKVDWAKNTCKPYTTIWRATQPNMVHAATPDGNCGHLRVMTAKNGKQFAFGIADAAPMLYLRDGDLLKPIAGVIRIEFGQFGQGMVYPAMKAIYERTKAGAFLWQDANNDQTVQENELTVSPLGVGFFNWIDADFNAWGDCGKMLRPVRFGDDGRPVYDFSKAESIPFKGSNGDATFLWLDNQDDTVYTLSPLHQARPCPLDPRRQALVGIPADCGVVQGIPASADHAGPAARPDHAAGLRGRLHRRCHVLQSLPHLHARWTVCGHAHSRPP